MVSKGILQGLIIGIPHRLSGTLGAQERGIGNNRKVPQGLIKGLSQG